MFSTNKNDKSAMKKFLKNVDKKGSFTNFDNRLERELDKDKPSKHKIKSQRKQMHIYVPSFNNSSDE